MNKILTASLVISAIAFAGSSASAQMTEETARADLETFVEALVAKDLVQVEPTKSA